MKAERRWSGEDPLATSDGCGEWIYQRSERRRRSRSKIASSDPTLKLLDEKTSFPNVSKDRQQWLKDIFFYAYLWRTRDSMDCPFPPNKECEIGQYLDAECPIYSQSFGSVPVVEVGKELNVLDLLGDTLLSFNTCSPNVPSIPNVERIQTPKFKSSVMASTSSTTPSVEKVNVESTLNLKGKYVMICCVFVPSIWSSAEGSMVYQTALASHELAKRDDFVLLVVPMMREGFTHSSSAYHHFLSGFSCLAVPFDEFLRREQICSALGFDGDIKIFILDPSQKVLYHGLPDMFCEFGGAERDCFPFTLDRQKVCSRRDYVLHDRSLNELLDCSDTDVLYNIEYLAGGRMKEDSRITISELKQKFVGIYVCSDAESLLRIQKVYEECKRKDYELEIVVVCFPFLWQVPPKMVEEFVIDALARLKLLGWWVFPFNNTVCHRLWRMREIDSTEEALFIVDPIRKYVDPYGSLIICDFGMDGYPFTRRGLVEKELQRKMGLTLKSLLPWTCVCRKLDSGSIVEIPVEKALEDKIVFLYLYEEPMSFFANKLAAWYTHNIKGKHSNVEVVTVSMDGHDNWFHDMGWLVCPADPSKLAKVRDEYCHPRCRAKEILVAFGEDGRIQSADAFRHLESQGPPFHGDLLAEIAISKWHTNTSLEVDALELL